MIRVELGEEIRQRHKASKWRWRVQERGLEGFSREPLLDACRELKRTGELLAKPVGLFREGRSVPDLTCTVEAGAGVTVREHAKAGPYFIKHAPHWALKGTKEL
ncbi:MAG: hypothetical protein ABWY82_00730 [Tardiphaga sp.]